MNDIYNLDGNSPHLKVAEQAAKNLFGANMEEVRGPSRKMPLPFVRAIIGAFLISKGLSYSIVGGFLNRHRTSIVHYINKHEGNLLTKTYKNSTKAFFDEAKKIEEGDKNESQMDSVLHNPDHGGIQLQDNNLQ